MRWGTATIAVAFTALLQSCSTIAATSGSCTGLEKKFPRSGSVVCCPSGCGVCGGAKCATAPVPDAKTSCCPGPVVRSGKMCGANDPGPCVVHKPGDPTCSTGVLADDGKHCCPASCGQCGGDGCENAEGGRKLCCLKSRRKADSENSCDKFDPPCVLSPGSSNKAVGSAPTTQAAGAGASARSGGAVSLDNGGSGAKDQAASGSGVGSWGIAVVAVAMAVVTVCVCCLRSRD